MGRQIIRQAKGAHARLPDTGIEGVLRVCLVIRAGTVFASFFIQHITEGGTHVDLSTYCSQISDLISAIIIYLCGFTAFLKLGMNKWAAKAGKKNEKERSKK